MTDTRFYYRPTSSSAIAGPASLAEISGKVAGGELPADTEVLEAAGQTHGQLKRSIEWRRVPATPSDGATPGAVGPATPTLRTSATGAGAHGGSTGACIALGLTLLLIGAFVLLVAPGEDGAEFAGRQFVNLQRLYLGQTAAICGAVFLAAGIRPR